MENEFERRFALINTQHLTTAAATTSAITTRANRAVSLGRALFPLSVAPASCGTCWVGVLAGAEKLSEVAGLRVAADQRVRLHRPEEARPLIRLCVSGASLR